MEKPDFNYYRVVVETQHDPDILHRELRDLINECETYIEKALGGKEGNYLDNPHDKPEDRAAGRAYKHCAAEICGILRVKGE